MRGYLLDTNIISELTRSTPDSGVVEWFQDKQTSELYLASMTIAEPMRGASTIFLNWIDSTVVNTIVKKPLQRNAGIDDKFHGLPARRARSSFWADTFLPELRFSRFAWLLLLACARPRPREQPDA